MIKVAKYRTDKITLFRMLENAGIDCSTENFKLFEKFFDVNYQKISHNITNIQLEPESKFIDLEWSQILNVKSSCIDNMRVKSFLLDILTEKTNESSIDQSSSLNNNNNNINSTLLLLSEKELNDLYATLRECVKNIENYIGSK